MQVFGCVPIRLITWEACLTVHAVEQISLEIICLESGNSGLRRTDIRFRLGPDGEFYVLNKHEGIIRRLAAPSGFLDGDSNPDGDVDGSNF